MSQNNELQAAAQAVIDRWNSPKWEWDKQGPTADLIHALREAIAAQADQHHDLQKRLADLHLYEEISEHYAKCNPGPENLRDWVAERMDQPAQAGQSEPVGWTDAKNIEFLRRYKTGGVVVFFSQEQAEQVPLYTHPAPVRQPLTDPELFDIADDFKSQYMHAGTTFDEFDFIGFARAIEAKINEKGGA
jgi:hypothetical protein